MATESEQQLDQQIEAAAAQTPAQSRLFDPRNRGAFTSPSAEGSADDAQSSFASVGGAPYQDVMETAIGILQSAYSDPERYAEAFAYPGGIEAYAMRMAELLQYRHGDPTAQGFGEGSLVERRLDSPEFFQLSHMVDPTDKGSFAEGFMRDAGGMLRTLVTNPAVMGALGGFLTAPMAGGAPLLTPIQAGATTGALSGLASDDPIMGAVKGGVIGGASVGAGQFAGQQVAGMLPDSPWLAGMAGGGAGALTGAVLSGADNPFMATAQGAIMGGLSAPTPEQMPSLSDQEFDAIVADLGVDLDTMPVAPQFQMPVPTPIESAPLPTDPMLNLMQPMPAGLEVEGLDPTGQSMMLSQPGETPGMLPMEPMQLATTPEDQMLLQQSLEQQAATGPAGPTMEEFAATASPELQSVLAGMGVLSSPTVSDADFNAAAREETLTGEEAPVEPMPEAGAVSEEDFTNAAALDEQVAVQEPTTSIGDAAKAISKIYGLMKSMGFGVEDQKFALPERGEGQTDEEYYTEVGEQAIEYLGLSPEALADAGLQPGTPEYLAYILDQADAIIRGIFGDNADLLLSGESIEGLQAAFRNLTDKEAAQLLRALYVRGALGQLSFRTSEKDPFTGIEEYIGMLSPGIRGSDAARMAGYARSLQHMAGLPRRDAADALRKLLGRRVDLYGLQQRQDERRLRERFAAETGMDIDEDEYRRRRMLGTDETYWEGMMEGISPNLLRQLMAQR